MLTIKNNTINESANIEISRNTVKALTQMLCSAEGMNIGAIVDDLKFGGLDYDKTALSAALLLTRPDLCKFTDTDPRTNRNGLPEGNQWGNDITYYQFESYSILLGTVTALCVRMSVYNADSKNYPNSIRVVSNVERVTMPEREWTDMGRNELHPTIVSLSEKERDYVYKLESAE